MRRWILNIRDIDRESRGWCRNRGSRGNGLHGDGFGGHGSSNDRQFDMMIVEEEVVGKSSEMMENLM